MTRLIVVAACVFALTISACAEEKKAEEQTVMGTVKVAKEGDTIQKVEIATGEKKDDKEVVYAVKLDDKGKELAKLDGKKVEAKGTVEGNEITVTSFTEAKAASKPKDHPAH